MAARAISLAAGVLPDFSPPETVSAAAAAGFDATGVWVDPKTWTATTTRETRARLADGAIPVLDVEVIWIRPGPDSPDHFRILDIGAELGAANALVVSSEPDETAAARKLARIVAHGRDVGVRVSLEFGFFTEVKSLDAAMRLLDDCGAPDAGLLIDPLHLRRTGGRPEDVARIPASRFAYAQFCDAPDGGPGAADIPGIITEALDLRMMPGEGDLPLVALLDSLPDDLPLSVELRSKALRDAYPDAADRAVALARSTRSYLAKVDRARECDGSADCRSGALPFVPARDLGNLR
jgi:sugar phosphate isomerase/epimerase